MGRGMGEVIAVFFIRGFNDWTHPKSYTTSQTEMYFLKETFHLTQKLNKKNNKQKLHIFVREYKLLNKITNNIEYEQLQLK